MRRFYDQNMYHFETPQPSYWEATADEFVAATPLESEEQCDVAIVGGGYTGLSAALHLARDANIDARVLEAGHVGWGASGRNGGFCCPGGIGTDGEHFVKQVGEKNARDYFRTQIAAVELVEGLLNSEKIDAQKIGNAEWEVAQTKKTYQRIVDSHALSRRLGLHSELLSAAEFRERQFDSNEQFGARCSKPAFGLHPLRYCQGLADAAVRHGAVVHSHSEVGRWEKNANGSHRLLTRDGSLTAKRVIFATNGFMPERLHPDFRGRTLPIISAIVVTRPLTMDELGAYGWQTADPAINLRRILNYFRRLPDNRILFGGRGHTTGSRTGERATYARLEARFRSIWPEWGAVGFDYRWHGLICFNANLRPAIGRLESDDSVYFAFGYHGNGVNTATWMGQQLAYWVSDHKSLDVPDILRGLGARFPMPSLRRSYLRAGIGVSALLDKFG